MASISKRVSGEWQNTSYGIRAVATDTIATLPTTIYGDGTNATISIKGNTVQNGTPTPGNPIMPEGTGDKTGNLLNLNRTYSGTFTMDTTKWMNGAATANSTGIAFAETEILGDMIKVTSKSNGYGASFLIKASPNTTYTVSFETDKESSGSWGAISDRDINGTIISKSVISGKSTTFTTHDNCAFLNVCFRFPPADGTVTFSKIMLNTGSTALPFEPFGVKIPISSADTTTNNYLGEVETTRKIKKYEFTGNETFYRDFERSDSWRFYSPQLVQAATNVGICSHFEYIGTSEVSYSDNIGYSLFSASQFGCRFPKSIANTVNEFKAWLAAQYAAGTPVTVWYVLAEPTTGIVNEPLMKIEDYADEVNNISIPTTDGANALSVDTTLQPSEVNVNYHGWHMGTVHERTSGQWD